MSKSNYIVSMKNPLPFGAQDRAWSVNITSNKKKTIDKAAQNLFTSLSRTILNKGSIKDIRFQVALVKNGVEKTIVTYSADMKQSKSEVKTGGGVKVEIRRVKCGKQKENLVVKQSKPKKGGSPVVIEPLSPYYSIYPMLYNILAFGDQAYIDWWTSKINTPLWWLPNQNTLYYYNYLTTPVIPSTLPTIETGM